MHWRHGLDRILLVRPFSFGLLLRGKNNGASFFLLPVMRSARGPIRRAFRRSKSVFRNEHDPAAARKVGKSEATIR